MIKQILLSLLLVGTALFAQAPAPKPQPSTPTYGVDQLALYPTYDRASFESKFGIQAPPFDPSKPAKAWFNSTVPCVVNTNTTFNVISDSPSALTFSTLSIPSCDVSRVNLTGLQHFSVFVPNAVSNVVLACGNGCTLPPTNIGVSLQSTPTDAENLRAEINDPTLQPFERVGPMAPGVAFSYQKIDPNNPVGLFVLGQMNVEQALISRNAKGIASPGTWVKKSNGIYDWVPAPPASDGAGSTYMKVPVRDLLPNEKMTLGDMTILGAFAQVTRTDLAVTPAPTGTTGSGFSNQDRLDLQKILAMLKSLTGQ